MSPERSRRKRRRGETKSAREFRSSFSALSLPDHRDDLVVGAEYLDGHGKRCLAVVPLQGQPGPGTDENLGAVGVAVPDCVVERCSPSGLSLQVRQGSDSDHADLV